MAMLHVMHKKRRSKQEPLIVTNKFYMNKGATRYTIRYITRTGKKHEKRKDLVSYGSVNISFDTVDEAIMKMRKVQTIFKRKKPRPYVRHEVVTINAADFYRIGQDFSIIKEIANEIGEIFNQKGYQEMHAIHDARGKDDDSPNKGIHIHFIVNMYGTKGGRRFSESQKEFYQRRTDVRHIVEQHFI